MEKIVMMVSSKDTDKYDMPRKSFFFAIFAQQYKEDKEYVAIAKYSASTEAPSDSQGVTLVKAQAEKEAIDNELSNIRSRFEKDGFHLQIVNL